MNGLSDNYRFIQVNAFAPNLGAEIRGVDISKGVTNAEFDEIHKAFLKHQVLFFKEQSEIPPSEHVAFGKRFGHGVKQYRKFNLGITDEKRRNVRKDTFFPNELVKYGKGWD